MKHFQHTLWKLAATNEQRHIVVYCLFIHRYSFWSPRFGSRARQRRYFSWFSTVSPDTWIEQDTNFSIHTFPLHYSHFVTRRYLMQLRECCQITLNYVGYESCPLDYYRLSVGLIIDTIQGENYEWWSSSPSSLFRISTLLRPKYLQQCLVSKHHKSMLFPWCPTGGAVWFIHLYWQWRHTVSTQINESGTCFIAPQIIFTAQ